MTTVNHIMTGLGYFYSAAIVRVVVWALLKPTWLKWRFEREHGKGSYAAVEFLAGLKRMVDKKQKDDVS